MAKKPSLLANLILLFIVLLFLGGVGALGWWGLGKIFGGKEVAESPQEPPPADPEPPVKPAPPKEVAAEQTAKEAEAAQTAAAEAAKEAAAKEAAAREAEIAKAAAERTAKETAAREAAAKQAAERAAKEAADREAATLTAAEQAAKEAAAKEAAEAQAAALAAANEAAERAANEAAERAAREAAAMAAAEQAAQEAAAAAQQETAAPVAGMATGFQVFPVDSVEGKALLEDAERRVQEAPEQVYSAEKKLLVRRGLRSARSLARVSTVFFGIGGTDIGEAGGKALRESFDHDEVKSILRSPRAVVFVLGFSDPSGPAALNQRLAKERADGVKKYLEGNKLTRGEVHSIAIGSTEIISDANKEKNRAAEVWIVIQ